MKITAFVLLALICGQAVTAHPLLGKALLKGAIAKGVAAASAGALLNGGPGIGGPSAANPSAPVFGNGNPSGPLFVNGNPSAPLFGNGNPSAAPSGNGNPSAPPGSLYCSPKYHAIEVEAPFMTCPSGYNANATTLNQIACIKKEYTTQQNCFRSTECPAKTQNMWSEMICMPYEVRSALVGMLVVFKIQATLPFMIFPALKVALVKAVTSPVTLPAKLLSGLAQLTSGPGANIGGPFGNKFGGMPTGYAQGYNNNFTMADLLSSGMYNKFVNNMTESFTAPQPGQASANLFDKFSGNSTGGFAAGPDAILAQILSGGLFNKFGGNSTGGFGGPDAMLAQLLVAAASKLGGNTGLFASPESVLAQLLSAGLFNKQTANFTMPDIAQILAAGVASKFGSGTGGAAAASGLPAGPDAILAQLLSSPLFTKNITGAAGSFPAGSAAGPDAILAQLLSSPLFTKNITGAAGSFPAGSAAGPDAMLAQLLSSPVFTKNFTGAATGKKSGKVGGGAAAAGGSLAAGPDALAQLLSSGLQNKNSTGPDAALAQLLAAAVPSKFNGSAAGVAAGNLAGPDAALAQLLSAALASKLPANTTGSDAAQMLAALAFNKFANGGGNLTTADLAGLRLPAGFLNPLNLTAPDLGQILSGGALSGFSLPSSGFINKFGANFTLPDIAGLLASIVFDKFGSSAGGPTPQLAEMLLDGLFTMLGGNFGRNSTGFDLPLLLLQGALDKFGGNSTGGLGGFGFGPDAVLAQLVSAAVASKFGGNSTGGFGAGPDAFLGQLLSAGLFNKLGTNSTGGLGGFGAGPDGVIAQLVLGALASKFGGKPAGGFGGFGAGPDAFLGQLLSAGLLNKFGGNSTGGFGSFGSLSGGVDAALAQLLLSKFSGNSTGGLGGFGGLGAGPEAALAQLVFGALANKFGGNSTGGFGGLGGLGGIDAGLVQLLLSKFGGNSTGGFGGFGAGADAFLPQLLAAGLFNKFGGAAGNFSGPFGGGSLAGWASVLPLELMMPRMPSPQVPEMLLSLANLKANGTNLFFKQFASLATAGQEVMAAITSGMNPIELVAKSLLNVNITELINVAPQINAWVSEHLQNITRVNEITAEISDAFPDCLYRCCKTDVVLDTQVTLPVPSCSPGLTLNPLLGLCVGQAAGYYPCPANMTTCSVPFSQPLCVAETNGLGVDACKVLAAAAKALLPQQCPY